MKRDISNHTVSRWYRAPEIILLENSYNGAVDIWSLGCVLAEILMATSSKKSKSRKSNVLFPGRSCFPLSPSGTDKVESKDQLIIIIKMLGGLDNQDTSFLTDDDIIRHVQELNVPKRRSRLRELFPDVDHRLLDLLTSMLEFNPYLRITARDALKNKIFDQIRRPFFEQPCNSPLKHELEDLDQYDYDECQGMLTITDFKTILL